MWGVIGSDEEALEWRRMMLLGRHLRIARALDVCRKVPGLIADIAPGSYLLPYSYGMFN